MSATGLRVFAIAMALVAIADPAISSRRIAKPIVAVLPATPPDEALARRVSAALARRFTIVHGQFAGAAATVVAGSRVPDDAALPDGPLLVVAPQPSTPDVTILGVDAPATAPRDSRIPVEARIRVIGAARQSLTVRLHTAAGLTDQVTAPVPGDSSDVPVRLTHVATDTGAALLRVSAAITGASDEASTVVHVRDTRVPVLFFDPRPSWLSTFVRRSVEEDPRFSVTHRVQASRGVAATGGPAPASLRDALSLAPFAGVVIGAPEALADADVAGLETYARTRGGRIVLLMDQRAAGPADRLTGIRQWRATRLPAAMVLVATDSLRARDIAWPAATPPGAVVHAAFVGRDSIVRPAIFSLALGAGRVYTSGALDAWHYREAGGGFDRFWTNQLAEWSAAAPAPLEVALDPRVAAPGTSITVRVSVLAAIAGAGERVVPVAITIDSATVRAWPTSTRGVFEGMLVAPSRHGVYRTMVRSGDQETAIPLVVDSAARVAAPPELDLLGAIATTRHGSVVPEGKVPELPDRLSAAFQPASRVETWHPMRSPWWIIPFALALGAEWWHRRRRGLA